MGSQRVYAGARLADIDRRRARGCLWQGAHARSRLRPVRSGVRGLRAGAFARLADRCPRRAGSGRSDRHPRSLALIGATYPRAERNRALGVWAAASALTTAGGPVLGGWLTETFGWPSVFWINPPLALVAVGVLLVFAPKDGRIQRRFDVIGAAILASAIGALAWA